MTDAVEKLMLQDADKAMQKIWQQWFEFYGKHFRGPGIAISAADQRAFMEIAQPIMHELVKRTRKESRGMPQNESWMR